MHDKFQIQALCSVLHTPVEVVQAEGPSIVTGENYKGKPLILTWVILLHVFCLKKLCTICQTLMFF